MRASVVIPTLNGGPVFREVIARVREQKIDGELEIVVVDSGSTDGTVEAAVAARAKIVHIEKREFNHGLTRNRGIAESSGEIVSLLVQDAIPVGDRWLATLLEAFDDSRVAGAYSRQIPRPECSPFIKARLGAWTATQPERVVQEIADAAEWERLAPLERLRRIAFDDVASAMRRSVWKEFPYAARNFGEDVEWGKRVLLAGWKIVFEPRSAVIHSHNRPARYEFKRMYCDHQSLKLLVDLKLVPTFGDAFRLGCGGVPHYWRIVKRDSLPAGEKLRWYVGAVPFAFAETFGQWLGASSPEWLARGDRWAKWDRRLKRGV
jgi:glycosyltransferase involved in cell wall biosynthesis